MKVGYDVSQTAEEMAGCGYFAKQVISHMVGMNREHQFLLYPVFYGYRHPNFKKAFQSNQRNVKSLFLDLSWQKANHIWSEEANKNKLLDNPDIIHSNNFSFPSGATAKKVMTIYDMGYLDCPEFTTEANRMVCFQGAFEASLYADHIVTISEFSKASFLKYFPYYPEERISVVYLGNRPTLKRIKQESEWHTVQRKFGLEETFWLGVGTVEPRKNYRLLLEAYAELVSAGKETKPLYIAGGKGWMEESIQKKVKELGIDNWVKFLGYVTDEELSVLYSKCFAFVYPSHYEGFGLPVLEAMNCGAPVITSNNSSLPEVAGDAALYIDSQNANQLVQAMSRLNNDSELRNELVRKSEMQASKFSWDRAAEQILSIYQKVMVMESWDKTEKR
jgi:glycosyltransferase involved in cell wall biosynthesis